MLAWYPQPASDPGKLCFNSSVMESRVLLERVPSFLPCAMDKANKGLVSWKGAVSSWQAIDRKNRGCFHSMTLLHNWIYTHTHEVTPNLCKSINKCLPNSILCCEQRNYICQVILSLLQSIQRDRQTTSILFNWGLRLLKVSFSW